MLTRVTGDAVGRRLLVDASGAVIAGDDGEYRVASEVTARIATGRSGMVESASVSWFVDVIAPPPTLRLFGAGPIAEALCALAARAGFRVVVGDPRPAHARPERFPDAAAVVCGWPDDLVSADPLDADSFVVSLLHAERFEDVLLPLVLRSGARYVGTLGSRATHAARLDRLRAAGLAEDDLRRIHGPVGLAIGAVTPEEIAVAILAEMIQVRRRPAVRGG